MKPSAKLTLAAAIAVALAACGQKEEPKVEAPKVAEPPSVSVKIAHAGPLTVKTPHLGKDDENGVRLAIDQTNAKKITIDGKVLKITMMSEDDQGDPKVGTVVAQKLVDAKVAAVIGHFNSGASIAAAKVYSDAGIPQISPSSTNPKYTQLGFKTTFRVVANDDQQGPVNAKYAMGELKAKKIAVVDDSTPYGQGLAEAFARTAKADGADIVATEHTTDKDTDFKAILTKIKSKAPDLIFFGGIDPQAGPMKKQMKELAIKATLMGGDGIQTPNYIKLAGDAAEGTYASNPGLPKEQMPGGKAFLDKFKAKTGKEVELFAPMGYDAVFVFYEAMKRAGSTDPAKFLAEVGKTDYKGVIGPIAFDDKGDLKNGPLTVYVAKGGKWEPVKVSVMASAPAAAAPAAADAKAADKKDAAPAAAPAAEPKKEDKK